jgi:flagellar secretion chaperone FliS
MSLSAYNINLEAEILSSDPVELVDILYRLASDRIEAAREAHRNGEIILRGRMVTKAFDVLVELQHSLDFEKGGEIARNYARLYDYCQRRLLEGHTTSSDICLREVQGLIADMKEAWQAVLEQQSPNRKAMESHDESEAVTSTLGAEGCFA